MVRPWVCLHVACADVLGYAAVARRRGVCDGARDRKTGKRWHARDGEGSGTCKRLAWLDGRLTIDGWSRGGAVRTALKYRHTRPMSTQGSIATMALQPGATQRR
jgi:hypothetical protein